MGATATNPYAKAFNTAEGATTELHATLERARDERFRLIRLIKEVESRLAASPPPAPTDKIERLTDKVEHLDGALNKRFNKLAEVEARITKRLDQLARLELAIRDLTDRFGNQVQEARGFDAALADARRQVQLASDVIVEDTRGRLDQLADTAEGRAAKRLDAEVERIAAERVELHLAQLRDRLGDRLTDFDAQMDERIDAARTGALTRFEAQREAMATQLEGQHRQMLDQLAADLGAQHRDALDRITEHVDGIEAAFAGELNTLVDSANRQVRHAAERFTGTIDAQVAAAHEQARAASAAVEETLRQRIDAIRGATDGLVTMLEDQYAQRIEAIPRRAANAVEQAEQDLRERVNRLQVDAVAQVERTIAPLRRQVIDALQRVGREAAAPHRAADPAPVVTPNVLDLMRRMSPAPAETSDRARDAA